MLDWLLSQAMIPVRQSILYLLSLSWVGMNSHAQLKTGKTRICGWGLREQAGWHTSDDNSCLEIRKQAGDQD
jgi:hypothetical protein